ncbi:MAG: HdeD family acid-resistance protein [Chloroflexota bacterium]|jgi:uncharacterized membrane protein HdeD (DUF308 family)
MRTYVDIAGGEDLHRRWKWFVALGVVIAVLGLIALFNAVDATLVTTIFVGFMLLFAGGAQIAGAFMGPQSAGRRILHGFLGVLYIVVGLDLVANPLAGAITLTLVVAIFLVIDGISRLWTAFSRRPAEWVLLAVIGVVDILLGAWLWTGIPFTGVAIGFFVGFQLLFAGLTWIAMGWMARSAPVVAAAAPA